MRIVVDAMGSDHCPIPDIDGAVQAARSTGETIILIGDQALIKAELEKHDTSGLILEIVHASQAITMDDHPGEIGRTKKESSMMLGMNLVRDGKADAFVTAGNTGAALAVATLHSLRRIPGVRRPALTSLINTGEKLLVLTDLGANADARPEWMLQFGIMASIYAERVMQRERPRVALLSNGEEAGKGNTLVRDSTPLFVESSLNFIGNVEPREMLAGNADVIVADGFVGNLVLKTIESIADLFFARLRKGTNNPLRLLGAVLLRPVLREMYHQVDPFEVGGAPLLGVNGVVIIAHGRSSAKGIKNAIIQARNAVQGGLITALREGMAQYSTGSSDPVQAEDDAIDG